MPLDPQAEAFLRQLEEAGGPVLNEMSPAEAREALAATVASAGEPEPVGDITNRSIPGPGGDLPLRIYTPEGKGLFPALVYFHGGGWVAGDLAMVDPTCTMLTNRAGAVVVSVDYRLAPEYKFPAPLTDCYAATRWVSENASELGVDPQRVGVGGDSAGGNLAAGVAVTARENASPELAFQLLFYPVMNMDYATQSYQENGEGYFLTTDMMRWFWAHYLESAESAKDMRAAPLLIQDAKGLPPAFVVTAEFDPLRDEGEAYAELLRQSGIEVATRRYEGQIHGFVTRNGIMDAGKRAIDDAAAQIRQALGAQTSARTGPTG